MKKIITSILGMLVFITSYANESITDEFIKKHSIIHDTITVKIRGTFGIQNTTTIGANTIFIDNSNVSDPTTEVHILLYDVSDCSVTRGKVFELYNSSVDFIGKYTSNTTLGKVALIVCEEILTKKSPILPNLLMTQYAIYPHN